MTATDVGTRDLSGIRPPGASHPGGASPRLLAAGAIGNLLEWYDFASYGFLAPIFARTFFPAEDALVGLISAFGLFGAAFLMRPLGAILFGHGNLLPGRIRAVYRLDVNEWNGLRTPQLVVEHWEPVMAMPGQDAVDRAAGRPALG